ncbi:MAG: ribonuclease H-like domain-containing protein, partial [Balneolaceae bacterium]
FSHIPSIGVATEKRIWDSGVCSIDEFIKSPPGFLSGAKLNKINRHILLSRDSIRNRDAGYFYESLPSKEHWRLFREYQDSAAYIDIETTGLGGPDDIITTIALYDGKAIRHYVNGVNLDDFVEDIRTYKIIITYNGKTFDVPFIERFFGISLPHPHLDLRYILSSLGYSGGLKSCEIQLGIRRPDGLAGVEGFFAVLLWRDYVSRKNRKSLDTLLSYNIEDVLNLECLMIEAYNRKAGELPFAAELLTIPPRPENPFRVCEATVSRIRDRFYWV